MNEPIQWELVTPKQKTDALARDTIREVHRAIHHARINGSSPVHNLELIRWEELLQTVTEWRSEQRK